MKNWYKIKFTHTGETWVVQGANMDLAIDRARRIVGLPAHKQGVSACRIR